MVIILGDILADYAIRIEQLQIQPKDLQRVSYLGLGPGGACNVAIMASHLGLSVCALGEVGQDLFGEIVLEGLVAEGVDVSRVIVTPEARTPVANVLVDEQGEPAYLGFPGTLRVMSLPDEWRPFIATAEALYADGWVDQPGETTIILAALREAHAAGVPTFFDPGPGNPKIDNTWHTEAAGLSTVLLATEEEAHRLSGEDDPVNSARVLLGRGSRLVVIKRGMAGCFLLTEEDLHIAPGLPVMARDATGAGDSLAAAVMYGYLNKFDLEALGDVGNATGAAKVLKLGTGHNMPTIGEVNAMLRRFGSTVVLERAAADKQVTLAE
ncbi:MAG: carbohydrate kinase family protein [Anaerolineae bacterium]|uniref:carbohydrate kinase family protein n=1 Tax=Promineifilum sp. TaxID=2664178 RepID=UPI001D235224|nr:carbohydrate kinase family protein [Anaerolineales bacterium]MCB8934037.1 carbohydrate kinase family protein [Promineifilum sp.]MCO5179438.1 carbohydrate kinase family protein [Promineifilum sp.]MCW5845847.1 carbohydrate kinase family protein [Anaerolineae bacterium]